MPIRGNYPYSTRNSTDTPLAAGETFIGSAESSAINAPIRSVVVSAYSDVPSAVEGLKIQQSQNGSDWVTVEKCLALGNRTTYIKANVDMRYIRACYRTSEAQSEFRLQTVFSSAILPTTVAEGAASVRLSSGDGFVDHAREQDTQTATLELLREAVTEQRITNAHLAILTGEQIKEEDLE